MPDLAGRLGALRVPLFRRFLIGNSFSSLGHWVTEITITWIILSESGSATAGGLVLAALVVPMLVTGIPAGALTDRIGPRTIMVVGQSMTSLALVVGAALALVDQFSVVVALAIVLVVGASDGLAQIPAQTIVPRLVEPRLMASAISLSPLQWGAGRLAGGLIGGVGLAVLGAPIALGTAAVGFGISALAVWSLPVIRGLKGGGARLELGDLREVFAWLHATRAALALFAVGLGASIFTYTYLFLLPVVSRDLLGAGASGLGLLTIAGGVGFVLAAFVTEPLGRRFGQGRVVVVALGVAALAIACLAVSRSIALSITIAGFTAGALTTYSSTTNFLLQALAPPEMRGRLLSFYTFMFWGVQPIASIGAGLFADRVGASPALLLASGGTLVVVGVAVLGARPTVRLRAAPDGRLVLTGSGVSGAAPGATEKRPVGSWP